MKLTYAAAAVGMATLIISATSTAHAPTFYRDGNWLFEQCKSSADNLPSLECRLYIEGVTDGAAASATLGGRETACPPEGVQVRQLQEIVTRSLGAQVERRHDAAAGLVLAAVGEAFHCALVSALFVPV